jgi:thioredoxin reductase
VIVVGGGYAGLSAALQLARARRRVLVIDSGVPRNRFASHSHGYLGRDGHEGASIIADGRAQLLAYDTVSWVTATAIEASGEQDAFTVESDDGDRHHARRLVLAVGVLDTLPDIPGAAERWGRGLYHCPYCHGYELGGRDVGVLGTCTLSAQTALLLPDWGKTTYFTRGLFEPTAEEHTALARRDVTIVRDPILAIEQAEDASVLVHLVQGRRLSFAGLFIAAQTRVASPLPVQLGCVFEEGPRGPFVKTDSTQETSVPGVFACGDSAIAAGHVALAVGDGLRAGIATHRSLVSRCPEAT